MPVGVIINSAAIITGGIIGTLFGKYMSLDFKEKINMIFGVCAMTMGVGSIVLMKNMPAVVFAVVIGTMIGLMLHFGELVNMLGKAMQRIIFKFIKQRESNISDSEFNDTLLTIVVLFCASGTGIYGSIISGMSGDHTILISKSVLDLFTAMIFACILGPVVSFVAIPQFIIFIVLFLSGGMILPFTTAMMIDDFKAVGGVMLLATGFRMIRVRMFPTADMIPAMILAMPVSWIWSERILPML